MSSLVELLDPSLIYCLTDECLFPVVVDILELNQRIRMQRQPTKNISYKEYAAKKTEFILSMDKLGISHAKITSLLKLQYIFETFLHQSLGEKHLSAYFQFIHNYHKAIITEVFKKCTNFKIIFTRIFSNHWDYLYFLIEYFDTIKSDHMTIYRTLRCMDKVNFFDLVFTRINKICFFVDSDCLLFETCEQSDQSLKVVSAILNLFGYFCSKGSTVFISRLFSNAEKADCFKTFKQIVMLALQEQNVNLQKDALILFEKLIVHLNVLDKYSTELEVGSTSACRTHIASVLKDLISNSVFLAARHSESILEILTKYQEKAILEYTNEDGALFNLISSRLDFTRHKAQALNLLRIFTYLLSISNMERIRCFPEVRLIFENIASCKFKRHNMIFTAVFRLSARMKKMGICLRNREVAFQGESLPDETAMFEPMEEEFEEQF